MKKIIIALTCIAAVGCKKTSITPESNHVYVVGTEYTGTTTVAKYWTNGQAVTLSDGIHAAEGTGIFVAGGDVYVSGRISFTVNSSSGAYWKNGLQALLTSGNNSTWANSILVFGTDVYIAGVDLNYSTSASYWKNGQIVRLQTDSTLASSALGLAVSGGNVYVVGDVEQTGPEINGHNYGTYWANGHVIPLVDGDSSISGTHITRGGGITVSGMDVYIAGYTINSVNSFFTWWKNEQPVLLDLHDKNLVVATERPFSIAVSGSDVYVAGAVRKISPVQNSIAMYWKNSQPVYLTDGTRDAFATGLAVLGNDVYVSGCESNGAHFVAKYWKNGNAVNLSDGSQDAFANGIVVKPQ